VRAASLQTSNILTVPGEGAVVLSGKCPYLGVVEALLATVVGADPDKSTT